MVSHGLALSSNTSVESIQPQSSVWKTEFSANRLHEAISIVADFNSA
jgi:hypothetical protein